MGEEKISSKHQDAIFTFVAQVVGREVGVMLCDFRYRGGSFGQKNALRVNAFFDFLLAKGLPLVFFIESIGVRFSEGRSVFKHGFGIIPYLKKFAARNLLITCSIGPTLGLGAPFFAAGHYRVATTQSLINLTGPEVFRLFFGQKIDFEQAFGVDHLIGENHLIQERTASLPDLLERVKYLLNPPRKQWTSVPDESVKAHIESTLDQGLELLIEKSKSVRLFVLPTPHGVIGVFYNPYNKLNLIGVDDIQKIRSGLVLFARMGLKIVSLMDSSGGDPRVEENDRNIATEVYDLCCDLIDYPNRMKGVILGRCFGGAAVLSFPPFYGGEKTLVLEGARIGVMGDEVVSTLLQGSKYAIREWESARSWEKNYQDLADIGLMDRVISIGELFTELEAFASLPDC